MLERERERMLADFEREREKLGEKAGVIDPEADRFVPAKLDVESDLKRDTVGLVQRDQFQRIREKIEQTKREQQQKADDSLKRKKKHTLQTNKLSFDDDLEDEGEDGGGSTSAPAAPPTMKRLKIRKDPTVNTSFLPDKEREEREKLEREELKLEWLKRQEEIKSERIRITFSYWDGYGHRSTVECAKGDSIDRFLALARDKFPQIRGVSTDKLMFVKEDLIIPHDYTFYDFILNKIRGKSGPLFDFSVTEDIRVKNDATQERTESHPAKVVERTWYERNKHIFPVNRWEVFDPTKDYGEYAIKDRKRML